MNPEDQKIKDLLNASLKAAPSEAFVQRVMKDVRLETTTPARAGWFSFPKLVLAGAALAALFFVSRPSPVSQPAMDEPVAMVYETALLTAAPDEIADQDSTASLLESYFL